jgi:hypothetical protein
MSVKQMIGIDTAKRVFFLDGENELRRVIPPARERHAVDRGARTHVVAESAGTTQRGGPCSLLCLMARGLAGVVMPPNGRPCGPL